MFQAPVLINTQQTHSEATATSGAKGLYDRAYTRGRLHRVWTMLTFRSHQLCNLQDVKGTVHNRRYKGVHTVPLDQIGGSEGRSNDFDDQFNPIQRHTQHRWINVAAAMQQDIGLPPVELIKVGETYFVRDGHHRVSVARALGQKDIDAVVTAWRVN